MYKVKIKFSNSICESSKVQPVLEYNIHDKKDIKTFILQQAFWPRILISNHLHGLRVCIQRKLLELMYILFKTKSTFDADYEEKRKALPQIATEPSNLAFS
jgi:hypothetical protein